MIMRFLDNIGSLCVLAAMACAIIGWATLDLPLMGIALGLATLAAGLGWWVSRMETRG